MFCIDIKLEPVPVGAEKMNLVKIFELFPTEDDCLSYLEQARWKGKSRCPSMAN